MPIWVQIIVALIGAIGVIIAAWITRRNKNAKELDKVESATSKHLEFIHSDITLPQNWIDKIEDAKKLEEQIRRADKSAPHVIEIQQIGGSGKSCFTRNFFAETQDRHLQYDCKIWFSFYKLRNTTGIFNQFLDFTIENISPEFFNKQTPQEGKGENKTRRFRNHLENQLRSQRILIILDGFEVAQNKNGTLKDDEFYLFLKASCNLRKSHIIITTRISLTQLENQRGFYKFRITKWTAKDCENFFRKSKIGPKANRSFFHNIMNLIGGRKFDKSIESISEILGFHPLTMTAFAYLVKNYYGGDLNKSSEIVEKMIQGIKSFDSHDGYNKTLHKLEIIAEEIWEYFNPNEQYFMKRLSAFYAEVYEVNFQVLTLLIPDDPEFNKMINKFVEDGLIVNGTRGGERTITAHPMIKIAFRTRVDAKERKEVHKELAHFFKKKAIPTNPKALSELDDLIEWFQQCVMGELFKEAYNVWYNNELRNMLYFGGWFESHLEVLESLSKNVLEVQNSGKLEPLELIYLNMTLGHITRKLGKVDDALQYFQNSLWIASENKLQKENYEASIELGVTTGFRGEFKEALRRLPAEPLDGISYYDGARLEWIGFCNASLGNVELGIGFLEESIDLCRRTNDKRHLAPALSHLGDVYILENDPNTAEEYYSEAMTISKINNYKDYGGDAKLGLAECYLLKDDLVNAREYFEQANEISIDIGYRYLMTSSLIGLAKVSIKTNNSKMAMNYIMETLSYAKDSKYKVQIIECYLLLAQMEPKEKRQEYIDEAKKYLSETNHKKLTDRINQL